MGTTTDRAVALLGPADSVKDLLALLGTKFQTFSELQENLADSPEEDWRAIAEQGNFKLLLVILDLCGYQDNDLKRFLKDICRIGLKEFRLGIPANVNLRSRAVLIRFTNIFVDIGIVKSADPACRQEASTSEIELVAISDPGLKLDDEMCFIMMRYLVAERLVDVRGIVTTLAPSYERARLARGTLDLLGLQTVPVGVGSDGGNGDAIVEPGDFLEQAASYMPKSNSEKALFLEPGRRLLGRLYASANNRSLTLLIIASLKDAALFLRDNEAIFVAKTKEVVIMGGVGMPDIEGDTLPAGTYLCPDSSANQDFDRDASGFFFRRCQELGVRLVVVSRWAAYAAQLPRGTYDKLALSGSSIGRRLRNSQRDLLEQLWQKANSPAGDSRRLSLPSRCNREWFTETFCNGHDDKRSADQPAWDLVTSFNQYDTLALIAAVPSLREKFFAPVSLKTVSLNGHEVENLIIGCSKEEPNVVMPSEPLVNLMHTGYEQGLCKNHHFKGQVILILEFHADRIVDITLMAIMLRTLYQLERLHCVGIVLVSEAKVTEAKAAASLCVPKAKAKSRHRLSSAAFFEGSSQIIRETLDAVGLRFVPLFFHDTHASAAECIKDLYGKVLPCGVTMVISASLTAVASFVDKEPGLFHQKTLRVVLMGGARKEESTEDETDLNGNTCTQTEQPPNRRASSTDANGNVFFLEPCMEAQNNRLDPDAATRFYRKAQVLSVPLLVLSRFTAQAGSVPAAIFNVLASHCGGTGVFLCQMQSAAMQALWRQSCMSEGSPDRGSLPGRCDKLWFLNTFCGGLESLTSLTSEDSVWPHIKSFNAYSPLALLFAMPEVVKGFVTATPIQVRAATHLVVGWNEDEVCVKDPVGLQRILIHGIIYGARANFSDYSSDQVPPIPLGSEESEMVEFNLAEEALHKMLPPVLHFV